jgi:hypothetical protein
LNDVLSELSKPVWWVSVVIAGIAINLLSAYMKGSLDKAHTATSSWWRRRSSVRQLSWENQIKRLRNSEDAKRLAAASEIRNRLQSLHMLLLAILMLLLPAFMNTSGFQFPKVAAIFVLGFSMAMFFLSFLTFRQAAETANLLRLAAKES